MLVGECGTGTLVIYIKVDMIYMHAFLRLTLARTIFPVTRIHALGLTYSGANFETRD